MYALYCVRSVFASSSSVSSLVARRRSSFESAAAAAPTADGRNSSFGFAHGEHKEDRFIEFKKQDRVKKASPVQEKVSAPSAASDPTPYVAQPIEFPPLPHQFMRPAAFDLSSPPNEATTSSFESRVQTLVPAPALVTGPTPPEPSPTRVAALDAVQQQAEEALLDVERLLTSTAHSASADASESDAIVLRALASKDGAVASADFESLIQSVIRDATEKTRLAMRRYDAMTTSTTVDAHSAALSDEVSRLQQAGAMMVQSMHDIIAQVRGVVHDPTFIDEAVNDTTQAQPAHATDVHTSNLPTGAPVLSLEVRSASPIQPAAMSVPSRTTKLSPTDVASRTTARQILSCPSRVQQLKEQLIKNGLRDLMLDVAHRSPMPSPPNSSSSQVDQRMKIEAEVQAEAARQRSTTTVPKKDSRRSKPSVIPSPEPSPMPQAVVQLLASPMVASTHPVSSAQVQPLPQSLSRKKSVVSPESHLSPSSLDRAAASEVDAIMATLTAEQGAIGAAIREKRATQAKPVKEYAYASSIPVPSRAPSLSSTHVQTSPPLSPDCPPLAAAVNSPRLREIMKVELANALREMTRESATQRERDSQSRRRERRMQRTQQKQQIDDTDQDAGECTDASSDQSGPHQLDSSRASSASEVEGEPRSLRRHSVSGATSSSSRARRPSLSRGPSTDSIASTTSVNEQRSLEMAQLSFEREKLAWEAEKLRAQQAAYADLLAAQEESRVAAAASVAAAAAASSQQIEAQRVAFEQARLQLEQQVVEERRKMESAREELEAHTRRIKEAQQLQQDQQQRQQQQLQEQMHQQQLQQQQQQQLKLQEQLQQQQQVQDALRQQQVQQEQLRQQQAPQSQPIAAPTPDKSASQPSTHEEELHALQRRFDEYAAERVARDQRDEQQRREREREEEQKRLVATPAATVAVESMSQTHGRRTSLSGATVVGTVTTTPNDANAMRAEHRGVATPASNPAVSGGGGGSSRRRWSLSELTASIPVTLFPTQEDLERLPIEDGMRAIAPLSKYVDYDRFYQQYLDPTGQATTAALQSIRASTPVTRRAVIATPRLYLRLVLSLVDLHSIGFLQRCRPCVEVYRVESRRLQLVYEGAPVDKKEGSRYSPRAILLRLHDVCAHSEDELVIRVTHVPHVGERVLIGEHWTSLHRLQCTPAEARFPLLRARKEEAHLGPKEKGTLVIQSQDLLVRTSAGLVASATRSQSSTPPSRAGASLISPSAADSDLNGLPAPTSCTVSFLPSCGDLRQLPAARKLRKEGALAARLEFHRLEMDGTWSKHPVVMTEELPIPDVDVTPISRGISAYSMSSWRPVQLSLHDLCFGDANRPLLVKVRGSASGGRSYSAMLSSFQIRLAEVLDQRESCVVVLDAHYGVSPALINRPLHDLAQSDIISPSATTALDESEVPPPRIAFHRAHVYSTLDDLQRLARRAYVTRDGGKWATASSPSPSAPVVISGLHAILLDHARRKTGVDCAPQLNFALPGASLSVSTTPSQVRSQLHSQASGMRVVDVPSVFIETPVSRVSQASVVRTADRTRRTPSHVKASEIVFSADEFTYKPSPPVASASASAPSRVRTIKVTPASPWHDDAKEVYVVSDATSTRHLSQPHKLRQPTPSQLSRSEAVCKSSRTFSPTPRSRSSHVSANRFSHDAIAAVDSPDSRASVSRSSVASSATSALDEELFTPHRPTAAAAPPLPPYELTVL